MYRNTMYTNYTKPVIPNLTTNHSPTLEDFEVSGDELSISGKQNTLLSFTYWINLHFLNIISFIYLFLHLFYFQNLQSVTDFICLSVCRMRLYKIVGMEYRYLIINNLWIYMYMFFNTFDTKLLQKNQLELKKNVITKG